eukprot:TRINITY_DN3673_c0_g1_i1.p1 TRINITY_DN3673_c0_g1~~TRINITY_DN3673_c0_g1_i1.p1  ORF type:complete len:1790 (-),score=878.49 TRINITY_DN3673_c0_g1_i1:11-5380(-)
MGANQTSQEKSGGKEPEKLEWKGKPIREVRENKELDCSGIDLKGLESIPVEKFEWVEILNLSGNQLKNIERLEFLGSHLVELNLSNNPLDSLGDGLFRLKSLKKLTLMDCKLDGPFPLTLGRLIQLSLLDISHNSLTQLPSSIGKLVNLTHLNVSHNQLKEIPREIGGCVQLIRLQLNRNQLNSLPLSLQECKQITLLNISDNFISTIEPSLFKNLTQLQKCYMDHNGLLSLPKEIGLYCTNLKELNVSHNMLSFLPASISNLENSLQILDSQHNEFTDEMYQNTIDIAQFMEWLKETQIQSPTLVQTKNRKQRVRKSVDERGLKTEDWVKEAKKNKENAEKQNTMVAKQLNLYRLKGQQRIIVRKVQVAEESLNHGDCFILDHEGESTIFLWRGKEANDREKKKSNHFAKKLNDEAGYDNKVMALDDGNEKAIIKKEPILGAPLLESFWKALNAKGNIRSAESGGPDIEEEKIAASSTKLYRFSEASGRLEIMAFVGQGLLKDMLDSSSCFVLDCQSFIFVWAGMFSSMSERSWSMLKAEELLNKQARPACASIIWVVDGNELLIFKDQFDDWEDKSWDTDKKKAVSTLSFIKMEEMTTFERPKTQDEVSQELEKELEKLLKEGALDRKIGDKWDSRYYVLKSGRLDEYKSRTDYVKGAMSEERIELKDECVFSEWEPDTNPTCFQVSKKARGINFILKSKSVMEMTMWLNTLLKQKMIVDDLGKQPSFSSVLDRRPTVRALDVIETSSLKKKENVVQKEVVEEKNSPTDFRSRIKTITGSSNTKKLFDKEKEKMKKEEEERIRMEEELEKEMELERSLKKKKEEEAKKKSELEKKKKEDLDAVDLLEKERKRKAEEWKANEEKKKVEEEKKKNIDEVDLLEKERKRKAEEWKANEEKRQLEEKKKAEEEKKRQSERKDLDPHQQRLKEEEDEQKQREEEIKKERQAAEAERKRLMEEKQKRLADQMAQNQIDKAKKAQEEQKRLEEQKRMEEEKKNQKNEDQVEGDLKLPTSTSSKLTGPTRAGVTGRKSASTKNPVRERAARGIEEENKRVEREKEQEKNGDKDKLAAASAAKGAQIGGYGLLYAVGGAEASLLFKKASMEKKKLEETSISLRNQQGSSVVEYDKNVPRLIQIKGRRNIFTRHVELSPSSLNHGDVFLLDTAKNGVIFQWNGNEANRIVKGKAMDVAKSIKDKERNGISRVVVLENGTDEPDFWKFLGGKPTKIPSAKEGMDDSAAEKAVWSCNKLYKVIHELDGKPLDPVELVEIGCARLYKEQLEETECYILDSVAEVFVWTGKKTVLKVKNATLKLAKEMLSNREFWTAPLFRELPGAETIMFKEKFCNWGSSLPIQMQQVPVGLNTAQAQEQEKIDINKMHNPPPLKEEVNIDDGKGKIQMWRVEENRKIAIEEEYLGELYSGESYLILYSYIFKNKDCFLIYFWQGRNSSVMEKGTSALLTMELDDTLKGMAKEVRVVQNKEPKHFFTIFGGRIIVHLGKEKASKEENRLYEISSTTSWNTRALEVKASAYSLSSYCVFLLSTKSTLFIWIGSASSSEEQEFANQAAKRLSSEKTVIVKEGAEPKEFWNCLGGKSDYPLKLETKRNTSRLFECSIGTGIFKVNEITLFSQDDLMPEDVYLLDAKSSVYIWIGRISDEREKKMAMETAIEYVEKAPDGRSMTTKNIYAITQGSETVEFTCHFPGWDWSKFPNASPSSNPVVTPVLEILEEFNRTYTYEELSSKQFPKGIDTSKLESYLDDNEFLQVLGSSREQFYKLPLWHQQKLKREKFLF